MKALIINITGASIFSGPRRFCSDKVFGIDGRSDRKTAPYFKVPNGTVASIFLANLLRVLCGQRPVPSLRKIDSRFTGDLKYLEIARKSRFLLCNEMCEELLTTHKSIGNAWNNMEVNYFFDGKYVRVKGGVIYWDRLKRFIGDELFNNFINTVEILAGKDAKSNFTAQQAIEFLNKNKNSENVKSLCDDFANGKRKPMINLIMNNKTNSFTIHSESKRPLNALLVCNNIEKIIKMDFKIYVPVTDEQLNEFRQGTGVATFLEGGLASIEGIEDWSEIIESQTEPTVEGELCI